MRSGCRPIARTSAGNRRASQGGVPVARWASIAWDPRRFLAPYGEQFVEELVADCRRAYPGRDFVRRATPLPKPPAVVSREA
jgi:hypothetical protein